ncbi:MAG: hypothetical protein COY40_06265 [Alphaproteobacteria bacterium CG_4_10_14_0_8_um_filter_53_9]|nr:MAG: hypothetical protein COY40_06265 [Alphaproteobacteria bacterium CG_4_10_14_0_8_um_filter_53_9]
MNETPKNLLLSGWIGFISIEATLMLAFGLIFNSTRGGGSDMNTFIAIAPLWPLFFSVCLYVGGGKKWSLRGYLHAAHRYVLTAALCGGATYIAWGYAPPSVELALGFAGTSLLALVLLVLLPNPLKTTEALP